MQLELFHILARFNALYVESRPICIIYMRLFFQRETIKMGEFHFAPINYMLQLKIYTLTDLLCLQNS